MEQLAGGGAAFDSGVTGEATQMWLPASALACYEGNAVLRSWLTEGGLLTRRIRNACGGEFNVQVVGEALEGLEHVREVELRCGNQPWVFAQTRVPQATASAHPWLLELGSNTLGETLAARSGVQRTDFEYARLMADVPLISRALGRAGLLPQPLWARRSRFLIAGAPLLVQEVFFPVVGRAV